EPTADITLTAYDGSGAPIGSQSTTVTEGDPFTHFLSVSAPGGAQSIASFEVHGPTWTGGISMDDITITRPDPPAPGEPAPPPPPPDFGLAAPGDPTSVPEGDSVGVPIVVNRVNDSNGDIALTASGL